MLFRQVTHDDFGCAFCLIGDEDAGIAAVVAPRFEIDVCLDLARYMGVRVEHILETHNRADHVAGHRRLAVTTGARIDTARPVAAVCGSGQRAAGGARLLARSGASPVLHVTAGGVEAWRRAGHSLER